MSKILDLTAKQAIARSVSHDEIVHVDGDNQMHLDLSAWCDDSVQTRGTEPGQSLTEYWGTTDDDQDWRVHVHGHES